MGRPVFWLKKVWLTGDKMSLPVLPCWLVVILGMLAANTLAVHAGMQNHFSAVSEMTSLSVNCSGNPDSGLPALFSHRPIFFEGGILSLSRKLTDRQNIPLLNLTEYWHWLVSGQEGNSVLDQTSGQTGALLVRLASFPGWLWQQVSAAFILVADTESLSNPYQGIINASGRGKGQKNYQQPNENTGSAEKEACQPDKPGDTSGAGKKESQSSGGDGKKPPSGQNDKSKGATKFKQSDEDKFWEIFSSALDIGIFDYLFEWMDEHHDFLEHELSPEVVARVRNKLRQTRLSPEQLQRFPQRLQPVTGATALTTASKGSKGKKNSTLAKDKSTKNPMPLNQFMKSACPPGGTNSNPSVRMLQRDHGDAKPEKNTELNSRKKKSNEQSNSTDKPCSDASEEWPPLSHPAPVTSVQMTTVPLITSVATMPATLTVSTTFLTEVTNSKTAPVSSVGEATVTGARKSHPKKDKPDEKKQQDMKKKTQTVKTGATAVSTAVSTKHSNSVHSNSSYNSKNQSNHEKVTVRRVSRRHNYDPPHWYETYCKPLIENQSTQPEKAKARPDGSASREPEEGSATPFNPPPAPVIDKPVSQKIIVSETPTATSDNGGEKSQKQRKKERRQEQQFELTTASPLSEKQLQEMAKKNEENEKKKEEKIQRQKQAKALREQLRQQEKEKKEWEREQEHLRRGDKAKEKVKAEKKPETSQNPSPDNPFLLLFPENHSYRLAASGHPGGASPDNPSTAHGNTQKNQQPEKSKVHKKKLKNGGQGVEKPDDHLITVIATENIDDNDITAEPPALTFNGEVVQFASLETMADFLSFQDVSGNDLWAIISHEANQQINHKKPSAALIRLLWRAARANRDALLLLVRTHALRLLNSPLRLLRTIQFFHQHASSPETVASGLDTELWAARLSTLPTTVKSTRLSQSNDKARRAFMTAWEAYINREPAETIRAHIEGLNSRDFFREYGELLEWAINHDHAESVSTVHRYPSMQIHYLTRRYQSSCIPLAPLQNIYHIIVSRLAALTKREDWDSFLKLYQALIDFLKKQHSEEASGLEGAMTFLVNTLDAQVLNALTGALSQHEKTAYAAALILSKMTDFKDDHSRWRQTICGSCGCLYHRVLYISCTEDDEHCRYMCEPCYNAAMVSWQCFGSKTCKGKPDNPYIDRFNKTYLPRAAHNCPAPDCQHAEVLLIETLVLVEAGFADIAVAFIQAVLTQAGIDGYDPGQREALIRWLRQEFFDNPELLRSIMELLANVAGMAWISEVIKSELIDHSSKYLDTADLPPTS